MLKDTQPYSGHLWSYPQYVQASSDGVDICLPDYWIQNGTEMKPSTRLHVSAPEFTPSSAVADNWHDWDMSFYMESPSKDAAPSKMYVTMAHGMPFTWIETCGVEPLLSPTQGTMTVLRQGDHTVALALKGKDEEEF